MSSPCRIEGLALGLVLLAVGCSRKDESVAYSPAAQDQIAPVVVSQLVPGGGPPPAEDPRGKLYQGDPVQIARGQQYYDWYNCGGCHFKGGGGIGPAFMDRTWIYGGRIDQIHNSIAEGRPNGMPVWGGKIPDSQIWEIAAYVQSLSPPAMAQTGSGGPSPPPPPIGATLKPPPQLGVEPNAPPQTPEPRSPGPATTSKATTPPSVR